MPGTSALFDPLLYAEARRPLLEASALPPWCYTGEDFYRREVERVFLRSWNFVGRADEVPEPGDYRVVDTVGESLIVIRGDDGEVRAFANSCTHRGTRLLDGAGSCRAVVCPYHGWAYARDGRLRGARDMDRSHGFDLAEHGLRPLRLEQWAGFLFVAFDDGIGPLSEWLGDLPERFAPYRYEDFVCVRRVSYDLACNWKSYLENAMEDYHTPVVHRGSIGAQDTVPEDTRGQWDAIFMESPRSIATLPEDKTSLPWIEGLSGQPARGTFFTAIYPGTFFATAQDCMWWLNSLPQGPGRTIVEAGACFPRSTVERQDFETEVQKYYRRWDKSVPEDNAISERQHAGLSQRMARAGRLSVHEPMVHAIGNWVLDRVLDEARAA